MLLSGDQIRDAVKAGEIVLEPFDPTNLQPASYDIRVGPWAFVSSLKEKLNLSQKGVLVIEPGEFAVLESRERVELDKQTAAQLGLRSEYAQRGLLMLSGPQIDPGFRGVLVVRLVNLAPKPIALPYESPFLTTQFFRLSNPVTEGYSGPRQGQTGITARDIQELLETKGLTLGEVTTTLGALAKDVAELSRNIAELRGSVSRLSWVIPLMVGIGTAVMGIIAALR